MGELGTKTAKMKILFVAPKYDYGIKDRGYGFEYYNFYLTLKAMGHHVAYFDFPSLLQQHGRDKMNQMLQDDTLKSGYDLLFACLSNEELSKDVLSRISKESSTVTYNWFFDDTWRFEDFSQFWAPCFNYVSTTASSAPKRYEKIGYKYAIKTQYACNHFLYQKPSNLVLSHDVTFIGQPHGTRRATIDLVKAAEIQIECWGQGWESGRLTQEEMMSTFAGSKVNLNLTDSSMPDSMGIGSIIRRLVPSTQNWSLWHKPSQIKGRNFEVPGIGGFLLTQNAQELDQYYEFGKEIEIFSNPKDMIEKIHFYLKNEKIRSQLAEAGYARTMKDHTYENRFNAIFSTMGLRP